MSEWLVELQHPDASNRKSAIAALAKAKNTSALGILEQLSHHDPDERIREYAAQAMRYIQKQVTPLNSEPSFLRDVTFADEVRPTRKPKLDTMWGADLAIYILVNMVGCMLLSLVALPRLAVGALDYISRMPEITDYRLIQFERFAEGVVGATPSGLIAAGIVFGIFCLMVSLLTFKLNHLVATDIFGGASTFNGMLREILMPQAIVSAVLYGLFFLVSLANPLGIFSGGNNPFSFILTFGSFLIFWAAYMWFGHALGKAYAFGAVRGFLSLMLTFGLYGVGGFILGLFFGQH